LRVVLPYSVKHVLEFPAKVRSISPYDLESVVLEASLQPRITADSVVPGEVVVGGEGVVVGSEVVRGGEGFSHREYGLAVRKSVRGWEVRTKDSTEVCEDVVTASTDGAFLAVCWGSGRVKAFLTSFRGLVRCERDYGARPVRGTLGFQSATAVFEDGRSLVLCEVGCFEIGMPLDSIAFFEGVFYGYSGDWVVAVDTYSTDVKPLIRAGGLKLAGFLRGVPALHDGLELYVLDGGSLVRERSASGRVSAWGNTLVADSGERLLVAGPQQVADLPKDSSSACVAARQGVVCFRDNLLGLVDFGARSFVDVSPADTEEHAVEVSSSSAGVSVVYEGVERKVVDGGVRIVDEGVSVLRDYFFDLTIKHLLGDEYVCLRSPARKVEVRVGKAKLLTSSAMHECGGSGVLQLENVEVVKPGRVSLEVAGKPLAREVCLGGSELGEVSVEAVDSVTGDRLEVARLEPVLEHVARPQVVLSVKHYSGMSALTIVSDDEIAGVRLCCGRVCRELPAAGRTASLEVRECRLPAWVEVTTRRCGFLHNERIDVSVPELVDAVLRAGKTSEFRVGGFYTTIPVPEHPDIPPIRRVRARILPNKLVITLNSRVFGRGVLVAGEKLRPVVLKDGENSVEAPFSDKVLLVLDAGRRWLYKIELSPEDLVRAARGHAEALKQVLRLK